MTQAQPEHPNTHERVRAVRLGFSLDWWSVIAALVLIGLVVSGLFPAIPW